MGGSEYELGFCCIFVSGWLLYVQRQMTTWHLTHAVHGDKPRPVQAEALRRADNRPKFGQWLEQGLGKTALDLNEFVHQDDIDINIVLCPNSFVGDWVMAPAEWGVPWMPTGLRGRDPLPFDAPYCLYAVNYERARDKHYNRELQRLMERRTCKLTIDESTAIKNPSSSTFRAVIELAKRAKMVRELNGTPLTQNVTDYYGQLRGLGQLEGMPFTVYKNRFAEKGGFMGRQIVGTRNEEELAKILDACSFRALKKDWRKDLPPKQYVPVHLEMTKRQRQHYGTMMEEFYAAVTADKEVSVDLVLTQMGKLRQISSCMLMEDGEHWFFEEPKDNPKVRATLDIINSCPGKVIVSHFYKPTGDMLFEILDKAGFDPARIRGRMNPADTLEQKAKFNGDSKCRVLVGQQEATGRGHTLVGKGLGRDRCSTMVFFENDFSYYWRSQMEDRNYGRDEADLGSTVFDLITSPMDEIGVQILTKKKDLAQMMDRIVAEVRSSR